MANIIYNIVESPIGELVAGASDAGCCVCEFHDRGGFDRIRVRVERRHGTRMIEGEHPLITKMELQLGEYFRGKRTRFDLELDLKGSPFEISVWRELLAIPYGETRAYGELAKLLGKPGAARAVGRANGSNFLAIIVPCHRVIQEDGSLRGYGGGLWRKKFLLDLEASHAGAAGEPINVVGAAFRPRTRTTVPEHATW
jgi:AraC family transcriptional regulator of adaptative response/methylated-DNA-[protein]-cysteine methyltransferase